MKELRWINEAVKGEPDNRYLGDRESLGYCPKGSTSELATPKNTNLKDLTDYCDMEAEGANYHSFVGVHEKLAKLITDKSSEAVAKEVFFGIAVAGGLHEFNE
jgi:hypothetical protein